MQGSSRTMAMLTAVALLGAACGGARQGTEGPRGDHAPTPAASASAEADDVLSSCEPPGAAETTTVVEASEQRPSTTVMEQAIAGNPDGELTIEQLEDDGWSREEALHAVYAQVVGQQLLADATQLPGYVAGAYARPLEGEPFRLSFSDGVPHELDPDAYDLGSFGLQVTTGAAAVDEEAMAAAVDAARELGMRLVSGWSDEVTGTGQIHVMDATPEQVTAWEEAVEDPSLWCLVRAERSVPCDDSVIAAAEANAARQGEVLPNEQRTEAPAPARAEEVRRSYLGLTLDVARDKARRERRTVRVIVENGVPLGSTHDLDPGRLSLTVCDGIVVDARMDREPEG